MTSDVGSNLLLQSFKKSAKIMSLLLEALSAMIIYPKPKLL